MKKASTKWSSKDIEYLLNNYKEVSLTAMAEKLGRSPEAVHMKLRGLGIKFDCRKTTYKK